MHPTSARFMAIVECPETFKGVLMKRSSVKEKIGEKEFSADIKDGEVVGWQPLTLDELNTNIPMCIAYLDLIRQAIERTKDA